MSEEDFDYQPTEEDFKKMVKAQDKEQLEYIEEYNFCGLPPKFYNMSLTDWKPSTKDEKNIKINEKTRKFMKNYCSNIREAIDSCDNLLFFGGSAKERTTLLSVALMAVGKSCVRSGSGASFEKLYFSKYLEVEYLYAHEVMNICAAHASNRRYSEDEDDLFRNLLDVDVLAIDNVDSALFKDRENMVKNSFGLVLSSRNRKGKLTMLTIKGPLAAFSEAFTTRDYIAVMIAGDESNDCFVNMQKYTELKVVEPK